MEHLSKRFWQNRYEKETIGWDLGEISKPIKVYFDQVQEKNLRILIPGCGNGHEAEYLSRLGFTNVHVVDFAETALANLRSRIPSFPISHIHLGDFFNHYGVYDIIVEQTMFCAIDPLLRQLYADKCHELLVDGGKLIGLMFGVEFDGGPPYGGNAEEYQNYFRLFSKVSFEECYNSVASRRGSELFIQIQK